MNVAIMKTDLDGFTIIGTAVFDNIKTAQKFIKDGVWDGTELDAADSVAELPEGFGIGDRRIGKKWVKAPQPEGVGETEAETEPQLTTDEKIERLEDEIRQLKTQNSVLFAQAVNVGMIELERVPEEIRSEATFEVSRSNTNDLKKLEEK